MDTHRIAWSWSLHPGSWGIWLDREAALPHWLWRLNVGPLHIIGIPKHEPMCYCDAPNPGQRCGWIACDRKE